MKKIVIILLYCTAVFVKSIKAQPGVPDTLAYLQNIVTNKVQFVGQPFSKLRDSLKIQIKFFFPVAHIHHDKTKETSTSFAFYFPRNADEIYLTYPCLEVYWQPYLDSDQSHALYTQYRSVGWNTVLAAHYATGIISDIKVAE